MVLDNIIFNLQIIPLKNKSLINKVLKYFAFKLRIYCGQFQSQYTIRPINLANTYIISIMNIEDDKLSIKSMYKNYSTSSMVLLLRLTAIDSQFERHHVSCKYYSKSYS